MAELKIDTTLTEQEQQLMTLMLGFATGMVIEKINPQLASTCVRIVNKLLALSPEFLPYDETSFDFLKFQESAQFPIQEGSQAVTL